MKKRTTPSPSHCATAQAQSGATSTNAPCDTNVDRAAPQAAIPAQFRTTPGGHPTADDDAAHRSVDVGTLTPDPACFLSSPVSRCTTLRCRPPGPDTDANGV